MPWSSASAVPDPNARPTLLWPAAAVVKAQDELAAFGLDDSPRRPKRSSYPGIWIRSDKPDHGNPQIFQFNFRFPWCYGPELTSRHFLAWALDRKIDLVHIQPGKPTQNSYVESFNSKLREECLRVSWFQNLFEARRIIAAWRRDYNERRPHSSLNYMTPAEFAARTSGGKDAGFACLENAHGVSHFPTATAAAG